MERKRGQPEIPRSSFGRAVYHWQKIRVLIVLDYSSKIHQKADGFLPTELPPCQCSSGGIMETSARAVSCRHDWAATCMPPFSNKKQSCSVNPSYGSKWSALWSNNVIMKQNIRLLTQGDNHWHASFQLESRIHKLSQEACSKIGHSWRASEPHVSVYDTKWN